MNKFINILKVSFVLMAMMMILNGGQSNQKFATVNVYAEPENFEGKDYGGEVETEVEGLTNSILGVANPIIRTGGSLLIFVSVLLVGFDVILHRKDADGRTEAMSSLLWLAIGALVIGGAALFATTIWNTGQLVGSDDEDESTVIEYKIM